MIKAGSVVNPPRIMFPEESLSSTLTLVVSDVVPKNQGNLLERQFNAFVLSVKHEKSIIIRIIVIVD